MNNRRARRFVRVMALVVLLGAVLPNVAFVGHWTIRGLGNTSAHVHEENHANHCHGSSACADTAAYGFQWWVDGGASLNLGSGPERAQAAENTASPRDPHTAAIDPPPRYA